jgi:hypothetical protein
LVRPKKTKRKAQHTVTKSLLPEVSF